MKLPPIAWCFLSPIGRLSRQEFFLAYVLLVVAQSLAIHLTVVPSLETEPPKVDEGAAMALGLFLIATAWPSVVVQWKRVQDIGWPGYFSLAASFVAVALMAANMWAGLLALAAIVVFLVGMPGEKGANRFGPDPLAT